MPVSLCFIPFWRALDASIELHVQCVHSINLVTLRRDQNNNRCLEERLNVNSAFMTFVMHNLHKESNICTNMHRQLISRQRQAITGFIPPLFNYFYVSLCVCLVSQKKAFMPLQQPWTRRKMVILVEIDLLYGLVEAEGTRLKPFFLMLRSPTRVQ